MVRSTKKPPQCVISAQAQKTAAVVKKLLGQTQNDNDDQLALSDDGSEDLSSQMDAHGFENLESRRKAMNLVLDALKADKIKIIGITGVSGVGKTRMLRKVFIRAREQNLFDEVLIASVSPEQPGLTTQIDDVLFKLQSDLAEQLGLMTQINEISTIDARAKVLHNRLNKARRRVVVLLDDVGREIKLKKVGIPVGSRSTRCKVVLASRDDLVCKNMGSTVRIEVGVLTKEEGWDLFRRTAGDCVESEDIQDIAKDVADECRGLPIYLVTIARALSNKGRMVWLDAHEQLKESTVTSLSGRHSSYAKIKLSIDLLAREQPEAHQLLLICCLYYNVIKVENVVRYSLALQLFEDGAGVQETRNKIYRLIEYLKSCFLLMAVDVNEDSEDEAVTVNDLIRDAALSLSAGMEQERNNVHMHNMVQKASGSYDELGTHEVDYPKLELLVQAPLDHDLLNKRVLEQMQELRVFENAPDYMHHSLPAIHLLTNLRMLSLEGAQLDGDIGSEIGMLSKLQILSFLGSRMGSIPHQLGQLSNLLFLDLRCREGTGPIPSGIFPGLKKLEELYTGNFYFWSIANNGEESMDAESYAHVAELEKLSNLRAFQVPHLDPMELLDMDHFPLDRLERFCFGPPERPRLVQTESFSVCPSVEKILQLKRVGVEWASDDRIQLIVRSTTELRLEDIDWTNLQMIEKFESLRELSLMSCNRIDYIIHDAMHSGEGSSSSSSSSSNSTSTSMNVFMNLERLFLMRMDSVRELCYNGNLPARSLGKLKELEIGYLPKLRCLCASPVDPLCLVNLKKVEICECPVLESVFTHSTAKSLLKLHSLFVSSCGMLEAIVFNIEGTTSREGRGTKRESSDFIVHFPELTHLEIYNLPKLRGFYNLNDNGRVQPLITPLVMLPSLERLKVEGSHELKQIVRCRALGIQKYSACTWLQNLEQVDVESCDSLETVFDFEGVEDIGEDASILGKLEDITLSQLPKLEHVCRMLPKETHAFRNLRRIEVKGCGSLDYLLSTSMTHMFVNLERLSVKNCRNMKQVIKMNENCSKEKEIVFNSLKSVTLGHLEKLSSFCSSDRYDFEFPSLVEVSIIECPEMRTFCSGNLIAEKLCIVKFAYPFSNEDDDKTYWVDDLSETVHQFNPSVTLKEDGVVDVNSEDVDPDDEDDIYVSEEPVVHEYAQDGNEVSLSHAHIVESQVLDRSGTGGSIPLEQCTSPNSMKASVGPPIMSPSPPDEKDLAHSSSLDLNEFAVPSLSDSVLSASTKQNVPSTDSQAQPNTDKELSYSSFSTPYDDWNSKILVNGVYIKAEMKTTLEEILTANPNFLSKLRCKRADTKTFHVESAICCLENLRQCTACTISPELLASIKDSLDDLEAIGLDMAWLKRGYKRASLVLEKKKVVSALAELARLERETAKVEADFKLVKVKLEHLKVLRDASKAECHALMQEEKAAGNELFGGGFSIETSLGDGLLD